MLTTVFQPFAEMSSGFARNDAPALFTITSRRPNSLTARSTMPFTCSSTRTSTTSANARRPICSIALTTGSRCSIVREQSATSAPARANSIAMDLPMPVPPPVTIAVLPSRAKGLRAMRGTIPRTAGGCRARLRKRDLRLPARKLPLDALPDDHRREAGAVVARALLELVEKLTPPLLVTARRLGRAPHVLVRRLLGLGPRLVQMRHQEHDAVDLA